MRGKNGGFRPTHPTVLWLRHYQLDHPVLDHPVLDAVPRHRLDRRPFLAKQHRRLLHARRLDLDATGPPLAVIRDLKEEVVATRFPAAIHGVSLLSHSVVP